MTSGNELQYGLIGLGVLVVLGLAIHNLWQERRARKAAEAAFRSEHHDVLLEGEAQPVVPPPPGGRMEPGLRASERAAAPAADEADAVATPARAARSIRAQEPELAVEQRAVDCVVTIEAPAGVASGALFGAAQDVLAGVSRRLSWFGWDDLERRWFQIDGRSNASLERAAATLQLADRRGPLSEGELDRFYQQLTRVCEQFLAVPRLPARAEVLAQAQELDAFCAEVDVQIALSVIAQNTSFAGTKIRGLAESAGLVLAADGTYQARDDAGRVLFVLANHEAVPFTAEQLRHLQTHALVLSLDVPRVPNPAASFERMVAFAHQIADALSGAVVDDNRTPISERSATQIRAQVSQFEMRMERQSIPAGSEVALRLFA